MNSPTHMTTYVQKFIKKYQVSDKGAPTPLERKLSEALLPGKRFVEGGTGYVRQVLGAIGYAVCVCRPDMAFAQSHLQRFTEAVTEDVMAAVRHYMRYFAGTKDACLTFMEGIPFKLSASADSDWRGCSVTRRSTGGHVVLLGGQIIAWKSKMLPGASSGADPPKMSSTEAEFVECGLCMRSVLFFRNLHRWISGFDSCFSLVPGPIPVEQDNKGSVDTCDGGAGKGLRHLEHHEFFAREMCESGEFQVVKKDTSEIVSDLLTKPANSGAMLRHKFGNYNFRV